MGRVLVLFAVVTSWASLAVGAPGDSWPEFRGPTRDGHAQSAKLPLRWSEETNVVWKTAIHGRAWSTPVVLGSQVWMSTATEDGTRLSAVCVDRETGKVLHDRVLFEIAKPDPLGNPVNGYGSPSPVIEEGRVAISFGSYGTACLDTKSFATLWERRDLPCNHFRGPASSLVLWKDLVIFNMDGSDHQYVVALDHATGKTRWKTDRSTDYGDLENGVPRANGDFRKAFSTPIVIESAGREQLVSAGAKAAFAYDPATGAELWTVRYEQHSTASRPVFSNGVVFINSGYPKAELLAVRADGSGDVTESHLVWRQTKSIPNRSSPVVVGKRIFMVSDRGVASCLDTASGEPLWQERIGGTYSSSALSAAGRVSFFSEEGETVVIEPADEYRELARNTLADGCMASPAVAGDALYVRTKTHLYRIEERE